ncbi:hypothetical protein MAR_035052 [Mya arenaria]|uniref:Uncharacterized protein n=1 Tax=Mya arenaria TaxID=6604 RepID=A0ABY7EME7_MYAAR|nr:hypothetical protein MAR_035052 [Mya arenaria]
MDSTIVPVTTTAMVPITTTGDANKTDTTTVPDTTTAMVPITTTGDANKTDTTTVPDTRTTQVPITTTWDANKMDTTTVSDTTTTKVPITTTGDAYRTDTTTVADTATTKDPITTGCANKSENNTAITMTNSQILTSTPPTVTTETVTSKLVTTPTPSAILVPTTHFPTVKPSLESAVVVFNFTLVIQTPFKVPLDDFKSQFRDLLMRTMFNNIKDVNYTVTYSGIREGSIRCNIETTVPQEKPGIAHETVKALEDIRNNTYVTRDVIATNLRQLVFEHFHSNVSGSDIGVDELVQEIAGKNEAYQQSSDPCSYFRADVCPTAAYYFTCTMNATPSCNHKCEGLNGQGLCGDHGTCFFDLQNYALACKCDVTSWHVYHGASCEQTTATLWFVLAVSLGTGCALLLILAAIIIWLCIRRRRDKQKHDISRYDDSTWELPGSGGIGTLRDLSFRSQPDKTSPFYGRYHRQPGHVNQAFEPVFSGNGLRGAGMYFPTEPEVDAASMPSFLRINTAADTYDTEFPTDRRL